MPKRARELTAIEVKRLARPGFHAVGGVAGLLLQVKPPATEEGPPGARSWVLRTMVGGKRRAFGLGAYPEVSLASARDKAREVKEQIRQGVDPAAERRAAQRALRAAQVKALTFDEAARKCHEARAAEFRSAKHRKDWISSLERYASPVIGDLPVGEVTMPHILRVLEPIWQTRTETATRVRQRIETVLTWATVSGLRSGENPARWEGNLKEVLPNPSKITRVQHHRALPWQEVGTFMVALRKREGMAARALEFLILTAARSGEVRGATWSVIDLRVRLWTVPAERIKAGRIHKVPLS
ncbi:MAG TPA: integrase arm-type DNA-binding domain-containing protein, partial [Gammaproteobacteria bacterium]|nr:integrase arm-type DNA-binding domain-containing protein [Gammaproteobacteria bacterium]